MNFKFDPCSICVWAFEPNSWYKRLWTCKLIPCSRDSCVFIKNTCGPQVWSMWWKTWAFETNPWRRQWAMKPVSCHDEYVSNILECVDCWAKAQPREKRETNEWYYGLAKITMVVMWDRGVSCFITVWLLMFEDQTLLVFFYAPWRFCEKLKATSSSSEDGEIKKGKKNGGEIKVFHCFGLRKYAIEEKWCGWGFSTRATKYCPPNLGQILVEKNNVIYYFVIFNYNYMTSCRMSELFYNFIGNHFYVY